MQEQDKLIRIARYADLVCMLKPIPVGNDVIRQRSSREFSLLEFLIARRFRIHAVRIKLEKHVVPQGWRYVWSGAFGNYTLQNTEIKWRLRCGRLFQKTLTISPTRSSTVLSITPALIRNTIQSPRSRRYQHATERGGSIRRMRVGESITLVALLSSEIVGFVDARLEQSPDPMHRRAIYCHVAEIAVNSGYRNQGIGTQLLRTAETWGRRRGAELASLEYHAANMRAGLFYRRQMGYRVASITAVKRL
jgi:ribosomal protein S18 acetylase RimI-like enzyme